MSVLKSTALVPLVLVAFLAAGTAQAQEPPVQTPPVDDEETTEVDTEPAQDETGEQEPEAIVPEPTPEPAPVEQDDFWEAEPEPLPDFDDIEFQPLEELDEAVLEQISPMGFFPHLDLHGLFRVRYRAMINADLGTRGTSAILPPLESYAPTEQPANPDASTLWSADMRLRLEPRLHITESLRVHLEADLLHNVVLGSLPRQDFFNGPYGDPDRRMMGASQRSPLDVLRINEAYGELEAFFGTLRAGRMDNHWGLGMFAHDGDCLDCDYGDNIDRIAYTTRAFGFYGMAALDFPNDGLAPRVPGFHHGQPYDLGQVDDVNQFTLSVFRTPVTREDRELQAQRLYAQRAPVLNGGLYFSYRTQNGQVLDGPPAEATYDPSAVPRLIYRGLQLYTTDLWLQFLYEPSVRRSIRVELEGIGIFGRVDNATNNAVGLVPVEGAEDTRINCFDADIRDQNLAQCTTDTAGNSTSSDIRQFGLALETEFHIGGPVSFGLNGGFATGGDAPNWGYGATGADALNFYRFNPDYHVDLILFREIIGTVTNAYYANPYATVRFMEAGNRWMEFRLDSVVSRAFDPDGAPGASPWLGLEFDAALRFIQRNAFQADLLGGILFPFDGLGAVTDRPRLTVFGDLPPTFGEDRSPGLSWTVQGRLGWMF
jgi:uncharacterized protein (TIGR04551 family)